MTKSYLFSAVTSSLFLLLVVPLLTDHFWRSTEMVSVVALSVISIAVGGLTAETFVIVTRKEAVATSTRNAKKYFTSLTSSVLFLAIVAPSIGPAVDSARLVDAASVAILLVLSLALGGLTADGFFALFFAKALTSQYTSGANASIDVATEGGRKQTQLLDGKVSFDIVAHIDSLFRTLGVTLDTKMQELKEQVQSTILEVRPKASSQNDSMTNRDSADSPAPTKTTQPAPQQLQPGTPSKDQIVDVLLGKAKVGGK
jgi:hypothetical protein